MSKDKPKPLKEWTKEELESKLTDKQQAYVDEYLINGFNGVQAALEVYATDDYSTAGSISVENLQKPAIKELIKRHLQDRGAERDEVVARLAAQARGDIGDMLKVNDSGHVEISLKLAKELGLTHLIKKVKQSKRFEKREGQEDVHYVDTTVELYSSSTALDKLARVHGLYKDNLNLEVEGVVGVLKTDAPPEPEAWVEMMREYREKFNDMERDYE